MSATMIRLVQQARALAQSKAANSKVSLPTSTSDTTTATTQTAPAATATNTTTISSPVPSAATTNTLMQTGIGVPAVQGTVGNSGQTIDAASNIANNATVKTSKPVASSANKHKASPSYNAVPPISKLVDASVKKLILPISQNLLKLYNET